LALIESIYFEKGEVNMRNIIARLKKQKPYKTIISFQSLTLIIISSLILQSMGCATMFDSIGNKGREVKVTSTPPGATFTVYNKADQPFTQQPEQNSVTPATINWQKDFHHIKANLGGYPSQTAKLKPKSINLAFLGNFGIIGLAIVGGLMVDIRAGDPHENGNGVYTPDEARRAKVTNQVLGAIVCLLGGAGVVIDIVNGHTMYYHDTISINFNETSRTNTTPSENSIDDALPIAIEQAFARVPSDSKIAILSMSATTQSLQEYVVGELEYLLTKQDLNVVDRTQLEKIRTERHLQTSSDIDDRTSISMGKFLGAGFIVTALTDGAGSLQRLRLRVLDVETAEVVGIASVPFGNLNTRSPLFNEENALLHAIEQATINVEKNARIAMLQVTTLDSSLKDYILHESEFVLLNQGYRIVDRNQLNSIITEQGFQRSSEVDDNTAVAIGKIAGVNYLITGRIDGIDNLRRLRLRVLDVETATVVGVASVRF